MCFPPIVHSPRRHYAVPVSRAWDIPGWSAVIDWFGFAPNFHDAEVVSIDLRRHPETSSVRIHVWRTNADVAPDGYFRRDRHAIATVFLSDIASSKLDGWNAQNVLSELSVDRSDDGFTLRLDQICGVEGAISAAEMWVTIEPTKERDSRAR